MSKILFVLILVLSACTNTPYSGDGLAGPDEFVMDSYKIREGKFSVLEMEGKEIAAFPPSCLEECAGEMCGGDVHGKVQLAGAVDVPEIAVDGTMRLFEVLAHAKVPTSANLFKSYLLRDNQFLPVDFYKLLKEGDMSQNIVIRGGDKIYIAPSADANVIVFGEVGAPGAYDMPSGFMRLTEALALAKGITPDGDRRYIQVIRGSMCNPKIYTLHWQHVLGLPSDSLLLMPGDIVYVAATPITEWSRFVTKLLPPFIFIGFYPQ